MMKVLFSPQISERVLSYEFNNDIITAILDGKKEVFDFSGMPNGKIENPITDIETSLDIDLILSAERINEILYVKLLNLIDPNNSSYEERFPEWFEVKSDGKD